MVVRETYFIFQKIPSEVRTAEEAVDNAIASGKVGVGDFVADWAAKSGKSAQTVENEFFKNARPTSLIKRFATPEEVAALVTFVASPLSAATNGAALRVDGGVVKSAF